MEDIVNMAACDEGSGPPPYEPGGVEQRTVLSASAELWNSLDIVVNPETAPAAFSTITAWDPSVQLPQPDPSRVGIVDLSAFALGTQAASDSLYDDVDVMLAANVHPANCGVSNAMDDLDAILAADHETANCRMSNTLDELDAIPAADQESANHRDGDMSLSV